VVRSAPDGFRGAPAVAGRRHRPVAARPAVFRAGGDVSPQECYCKEFAT